MKRVFKTTGLYKDVDCVQLKVAHNKNKKAYGVEIAAIGCENGRIFTVIGSEYFSTHKDLFVPVVVATRKSEKKEQEAIDYMNSNTTELLQKYLENVIANGGASFEILNEVI